MTYLRVANGLSNRLTLQPSEESFDLFPLDASFSLFCIDRKIVIEPDLKGNCRVEESQRFCHTEFPRALSRH